MRTYIQSGNVLFKPWDEEEALRSKIELQIEKVFGFWSWFFRGELQSCSIAVYSSKLSILEEGNFKLAYNLQKLDETISVSKWKTINKLTVLRNP